MMVCNMNENSYIEIIQTWGKGAIVMLIQSSQDFYFSQAFKHWGYFNYKDLYHDLNNMLKQAQNA